MRRTGNLVGFVLIVAALLGGCASTRSTDSPTGPVSGTHDRDVVLREARAFFGRGAEGLAEVVNRLFRDRGNPSAYIKGEEGGGALGVGLRYGRGTLYASDGTTADVFWRGPSVGLDVGGSASQAFILVYDLESLDALYTRYGGVEGSLYVVGGISVNYNRNGNTLLAPVRFGVGWRQGVNVGYLHLSPERSISPF